MSDLAFNGEETFTISPSGASATCNHCGTVYDRHAVDILEVCPPLGDGCEHCDPEPEDEV